MKEKEEVTESLGVFRDFSFTPKSGKGKGGKKHPRYYIYIQNPKLIDSPKFPFKKDDRLLIKVKDGKLIISKVRIVIQEV